MNNPSKVSQAKNLTYKFEVKVLEVQSSTESELTSSNTELGSQLKISIIFSPLLRASCGPNLPQLGI